MSLFCCPLCAAPLSRGERAYACPGGHSFDRAREGYVHLLPVSQKHSRSPGDDREMARARSRFLDGGWYAPLRRALCALALEHTGAEPAVLDAGCGEGYYTAGIHAALEEAGRSLRTAGVDLSKFALRRAAKRLREGEFAVASVYRLPLAGGSVDLLANVFSPLSAEEFARVLRPGGLFYYVVPAPLHLWEMKQVLYGAPYENPARREDYPGFAWQRAVPLRYTIHLDCPADILSLFHMTPYAWKTPRQGAARLEQLERLDTQVGFDLHIYRRT